ncbi:MAG: metallophosphoesterase [Bacteroidetes bacterium]|nr:metallophosphoesterase [Bacteroidota bacterium]
MIKKFNILFLISVIFLSACDDMFDYSPYVINFEGENKDVNRKNIEKLPKKNLDDTIRIAFVADTHRFFDEFEGFVNAANDYNRKKPIDFVIHVGDIADFGLPKQYLWGNSFLLNLNCPYFVLLGNHDLVGNGGVAYSKMFGDYDFSFIYANIKFVFINTNSLEFKFNGKVPDVNWLDSQLQPSEDFNKAVVIFHVPPTDGDFDPDLEEDFHNTLAKYNNVLFTVHGHLHHYELYKPYADSILYVNVYGAQYEKFNIITIKDEKFEIETCEY